MNYLDIYIKSKCGKYNIYIYITSCDLGMGNLNKIPNVENLSWKKLMTYLHQHKVFLLNEGHHQQN